MYKVYIIKSMKKERFYIGHTGDLETRLKSHNSGKVRSTKAYSPWDIVYVEEFTGKVGAYKRELKIKSYKGGEAFKKLIK
ncbi:MAG: GIY-YIG nuclease family protein [Armatimonadetes bacterium]|nr:GIY-YIG nuclease family protein [Armatimonadota bacterium]